MPNDSFHLAKAELPEEKYSSKRILSEAEALLAEIEPVNQAQLQMSYKATAYVSLIVALIFAGGMFLQYHFSQLGPAPNAGPGAITILVFMLISVYLFSRKNLTVWAGYTLAVVVLALFLASVWVNGNYPIYFMPAVITLLHLLASPLAALVASVLVLLIAGEVLFFSASHLDFYIAIRLFLNGLILLTILQFLVRQNRRLSRVTFRITKDLRKVIDQIRINACVFEFSPHGIIITDRDGTIVEVNQSFSKITGYARSEAIGRNPGFLHSGMTPKEIFVDMWATLKSKGLWRGEVVNCKKNGQAYSESLSIFAVNDTAGQLLLYVGIFSEANYDSITGLPNRYIFNEKLSEAVRTAKIVQRQTAVLVIAIDNFQEINSLYGHASGDALLKQASTRLSHALEPTDTLIRLGAGEFVAILLRNLEQAEFSDYLQLLLERLKQPYQLPGETVYPSVKMGLCSCPSDECMPSEFLKNAYQALNQASGADGDIHYFNQGLQTRALERKRLGEDIRLALEQNQLQLHLQPVVELATGDILKAEALVRWVHPERGNISPAVFIPLAEKLGLIEAISYWVFTEALEIVQELRRHIPGFQLSVNVSPLQLNQEGAFPEQYIRLMNEKALPGSAILVEVTENAMLDKSAVALGTLKRCADAGIEHAIDDFGTGYSSLSYLQNLQANYVKIDQSFIRELESNSRQRGLCESIVAMAQKLGLKVVAEGIETEGQRALLTRAGCDYGQGYLFSRPVALDEFLKLNHPKHTRLRPAVLAA